MKYRGRADKLADVVYLPFPLSAGDQFSFVQVAQSISTENKADSPVVQALRREVVNAFLLYLNYKHYHRQTYGPLFRDLHKMYDEFADETLANLDPIAERIRMIGQDPPAHPNDLTDLATVSIAAPHSTMHEMAEEAQHNLLTVIQEMREAAKVADDRNDPGTVDLLSKSVQVTRSRSGGCATSCARTTGSSTPPSREAAVGSNAYAP